MKHPRPAAQMGKRLAALVRLSAFGLSLGALSIPAQAQQDYPNKPVRLILPFAAGTGVDANAREIAAKMTPLLGQTVIIDNRPGAAGIIGTEAAAKAVPDGYSLYMGTTSTLGAQPYMYSKLPYNAERDFVPVSLVGYLQTGLIANPGVPANNARELIALSKAKPDTLNVATQGLGTHSHLSGVWFAFASGADLKFVPYNTSSPFNDLLGGQVQLMFDGLPAAAGNIKAGKLKLLAITGKARHPTFPDTATFAESGVPDYEPLAWLGIFAPAGTPPAIIEKVGAAASRGGKAQDLADRWRSYGGDLIGSTPAEFGTFIKSEQAKWSRVIKQANVKMD
jgi:tripartite-type tricarboxylate transporter receptor subunit TctC